MSDNGDDSRTTETLTEETVTMTADERVATYLIEDQMADLTDAIREAVQNGIDSPGSSRVLVSISPERSVVLDDGAGVDLESNEGRRNLSVLGAGSKQQADDETIGEWGIGKGAIIAKGAVRIWSHDTALHFGIDDDTERSKREVEAEAVAYVVGRYSGLDTSGSAFYLAAWESDDSEVVRDRLDRISRTAEELINILEN